VIKPEAAIHKGMPNKRFFGRAGVVIEKKGKAYTLKVKDGKAEKTVISLPVHLKRL
jgi:large subunit ribosomal protein L21e